MSSLKLSLLAVLVFAVIEVSFEIVGGATLRRSADRIADAQLMQGVLTLDAILAGPAPAGPPAVRIAPAIGAGAGAVNALLTRFKTPGSGERRLRIAHGDDRPR
jgi:hypothetical protein